MTFLKSISKRDYIPAVLVFTVATMPYSIRICHIGAIIFLVLWASQVHWAEKVRAIKTNGPLLMLLSFGAIFLIGLLSSDNKIAGWAMGETIIFFFLLPIAIATIKEKLPPKTTKLLLLVFVISCVCAAAISIALALNNYFSPSDYINIQYLNGSSFGQVNSEESSIWLHLSYMSLASGIGMNPIYFSLYLLVSIFILIHLVVSRALRTKLEKRLAVATISFLTIFVVFLSSRMMISIMCGLYVCLLANLLRTQFHIRKIAIALGALALITIPFIVNPVTYYKNWQEFQLSSYDIEGNKHYRTSTEIRLSLLWLSWKCIQEANLITGSGIGDVEDCLENKAKQFHITNIDSYFNPHNQYISLAIGAGIPCVVFYIGMLAISALRAFRAKNYLALSFLIAFALLGLTEPVLERQKSVILFAIFFPILAFHLQPIMPAVRKLDMQNA